MVFEGWVVDHLSSWLGHFLDLQRDQLRISLWRAWQTGVTLENIPLRLDAFEYLELPVRPVAGHIGRLQLQVPWQALRSPLVLEIADARLELALREGSDLRAATGAAGGRRGRGRRGRGLAAPRALPAWTLHGGSGWAWGLAGSLITFLVNRLQIRLSNVRLVLRDPGTGVAVELVVDSVQTCSPSAALRVLGSSLEEALESDLAPSPARVRKDIAVCGVRSPTSRLWPTLRGASTALNRVAEFCPDAWRLERRLDAPRMWRRRRYVNAVAESLAGERPPDGAPPEPVLDELEGQLSVPEITLKASGGARAQVPTPPPPALETAAALALVAENAMPADEDRETPGAVDDPSEPMDGLEGSRGRLSTDSEGATTDSSVASTKSATPQDAAEPATTLDDSDVSQDTAAALTAASEAARARKGMVSRTLSTLSGFFHYLPRAPGRAEPDRGALLRVSLRLRLPTIALVARDALGSVVAALELKGARAAVVFDGSALACSLRLRRLCGSVAPDAAFSPTPGGEGEIVDPALARLGRADGLAEDGARDDQPSAALTLRYIRGEGEAPTAEAELAGVSATLRPAALASVLRAAEGDPDRGSGPSIAPDAHAAIAWTVRAAGVEAALPLPDGRRIVALSVGRLSAHSGELGLCRWGLRHVTVSVVTLSRPEHGALGGGGRAEYGPPATGPVPYHLRSAPARPAGRGPASHASSDPEPSVLILRPLVLHGHIRLPVANVQGLAVSVEARAVSLSLGTALVEEVAAALRPLADALAPVPKPASARQPSSAQLLYPPAPAAVSPCPTRIVLTLHQQVSLTVVFDAGDHAPGSSALLTLRCDGGCVGATIGDAPAPSVPLQLDGWLRGLELFDGAAPAAWAGRGAQGPALLPFFPVLDLGGAVRLCGRLALAGLGFRHRQLRLGRADVRASTAVSLEDAVATGYQDEPGNFLARLHRERPNRGRICVEESAAHTHVGVELQNVLIGHAALARILVLVLALVDGGPAPDAPAPPSAAPATESFDLVLRDCVAEFRYQPAGRAARRLSADAADFLLAHGTLAVLEAPLCTLRFPLEERGERAALRDVRLSVAALGVSGHALLPIVCVPHARLVVEAATEHGEGEGNAHPPTTAQLTDKRFDVEVGPIESGARRGRRAAESHAALSRAATSEPPPAPSAAQSSADGPANGDPPAVSLRSESLALADEERAAAADAARLVSLAASVHASVRVSALALRLLGPHVASAGLDLRCEDLRAALGARDAPRACALGWRALTVDLLRPSPEPFTPFSLVTRRLSAEAGAAVEASGGLHAQHSLATQVNGLSPRGRGTSASDFVDEEGEVFYEALSRSMRRPSRSNATSGAASRYYSLHGSESEAFEEEFEENKASLSGGFGDDPGGDSPQAGREESALVLPLANAQRIELVRLSSRPGRALELLATLEAPPLEVASDDMATDAAVEESLPADDSEPVCISLALPPVIASCVVELATWEEAAACVGACAVAVPGTVAALQSVLAASAEDGGAAPAARIPGADATEDAPASLLSALALVRLRATCERAELRVVAPLASARGEDLAVPGPGGPEASQLPSPHARVPLWQAQAAESGPEGRIAGGSLLCTLQTSWQAGWRPHAAGGAAEASFRTPALGLRVALLGANAAALSAAIASGAAIERLAEHETALGLSGFELLLQTPLPVGGSTRTAPSTSVYGAEDVSLESEDGTSVGSGPSDGHADSQGAMSSPRSGPHPLDDPEPARSLSTISQASSVARPATIVSGSGSRAISGSAHGSNQELPRPEGSGMATQFEGPVLSLDVDRISVWLTQEAVAVGWALAQTFDILRERIAEQWAELRTGVVGVDPSPPISQPLVAAAKPGSVPGELVVRARLGLLACRLALLCLPSEAGTAQSSAGDASMPVAQAALLGAALDARLGLGLADAWVQLRTGLRADCWSPQLAGWEPLVEPWTCQAVAASGEHSAAGGSAQALPPRLALSSTSPLELTATPGRGGRAGRAAAGGLCVSGERRLCNASGSRISVWLGCEGHVDPAAAGLAPTLTVGPGETANLPVWPESKERLLRRARGLAGCPDLETGGVLHAEDGVLLECKEGRSSVADQAPRADRRSEPLRSSLFFQGAGASGWVQLDVLGTRRFVAGAAHASPLAEDGAGAHERRASHLPPRPVASASFPSLAAAGALGGGAAAPPEAAGLLASVRPARSAWGGTVLTLHSAVRVRNATGARLDVRLHTPLGLVAESLGARPALGTLGPGQSMWLPAEHALHGAICRRWRGPAPATSPGAAAAGGQRPASRGPNKAPSVAESVIATFAADGEAEEGAAAAAPARSPLRTGSGVLFAPDVSARPLARHASLQVVAAPGSRTHSPPRAPSDAHYAAAQSSPGDEDAPSPFAGRPVPRPAPRRDPPTHEWSDSLALPQLLSGGAFHMVCRPLQGGQAPVSLCVGALAGPGPWAEDDAAEAGPYGEAAAARARTRAARAPLAPFTLVLSPPLTLMNELPVPVELSLGADRLCALRPLGQASSHAGEDLRLPRGEAAERVRAPGGGARYVRWVHEQRVPLVEQGQGAHRPGATLRQGLDVGSGARVLALSCALWVFNCAGQPLALRQAADDTGSPFGTDVDRALLPEDKWGSVASSMPPLSRLASTAEFGGAGGVGPAAAGLGAVLSGGGGTASASSASDTVAARRVLGRLHGADPGWGLVAGVDGQGAKDRTTMWPSLPAGPEPSAAHGRLRLQLRASPLAAAPGQTYWSVPVTLDAQGGAAIVSVPCPDGGATGRAGAGHRLDRAALVLAVTASPVGEGLPDASASEDGALALKAAVSSAPSRVPLALYLAPRYLLVNALSAAVQYRQQGTSLEWELPAGASCPVRFADGGAPLRLCVRLREAGWLWSGGFGLDSPGDTFIKVRHRDRGDTLLLRVGVAQTGSRAGSLAVSLARQPAGFSPYRIENCSLATVLVRQRRVRDQQDTLRPYCCLAYAWDEPARPHQLVLELAGGFRLGTWAPDRAPQDDLVRTPLGPLRVVVSAEGPCRVVTILDPARHPRGLRADAADRPAAAARWELTAALPTLGLSLVVRGAEVAYTRVAGLRVRTSSGPAHLALELEGRGRAGGRPRLPRQGARALPDPAGAAGPAAGPRAGARRACRRRRRRHAQRGRGRRRARATRARCWRAARWPRAPPPAVRLSLVVWHRRPAGVVCVEDARLEVAPLSLWLAQTHVEDLLAAGAALRRVFALAHGETGGDEGRARQGSSATPLETPEQPATVVSVAGGAWAPGPGLLGPGVDQLLGGAPLVLREDRKLFINYLELSPLGVSLSFMPAPLSHDRGFHFSTLKRLVSLAELEDVRLRLAGLALRRPLIGEAALAATLQRHYVRALLPELVKLVGSAALFGDPIRLVHHLGLGVWAFLATPAVGLVESAKGGRPTHLVRGLLEGPRQAATHFAYALSNAATKATAAAQRALGALGVDRLGARDAGADAERGRGLPGRRGRDDAVLAALLRGLAGLVNEPAADLERDGLPGLVRGLARGSAGVVLLPLASLLDSLSFMAAAVRRAPDALGRWVLAELEAEAREHWCTRPGLAEGPRPDDASAFVDCKPLAGGRRCLVLTRRGLIVAGIAGPTWSPVLQWSCDLADLESASAVPKTALLRLVAQAPRRAALAAAPARASVLPLSLCQVECDPAEDVAALAHSLLSAARHVQSQLILSQPWRLV
ncbi:hypothetical protein QBZ16_003329 [Prototheca wickerhamii]|uniref:Vacuolar protein sorting-associated protein 13 VPS13 adaptor binding domain-containing protein n=1 Tax=Prototheca wickerhamii TaxID=3111 RepID=A0AAD9IJT9_PROWI|nr:hypothetical protein QBZ16_003329 [Prototheca wickerhamii]